MRREIRLHISSKLSIINSRGGYIDVKNRKKEKITENGMHENNEKSAVIVPI